MCVGRSVRNIAHLRLTSVPCDYDDTVVDGMPPWLIDALLREEEERRRAEEGRRARLDLPLPRPYPPHFESEKEPVEGEEDGFIRISMI